MGEEENSVKILKNALMKALGKTEKQIDKLILEKKKEQDKILGKGSLDERGAIFLIAADSGTNLDISSTSSNRTDFERYLSGREQFKEFYLFTWKKLEKQIKDLFDKIKETDSDLHYRLFNQYQCYPALQDTMETLFPEARLQNENFPKNKQELEKWELNTLIEIPQHLKIFFENVYFEFFVNKTIRPTNNSFYESHLAFTRINAHLRYPDGAKRPHEYHGYTKNRIDYDWTHDRKVPFEFMQCYRGVLDHIDAYRNFEIHKSNNASRLRFIEADRKFFDPLSEIEHPSNYILLSGLAIHAVYEFIELLQIWVDSTVINKKQLK